MQYTNEELRIQCFSKRLSEYLNAKYPDFNVKILYSSILSENTHYIKMYYDYNGKQYYELVSTNDVSNNWKLSEIEYKFDNILHDLKEEIKNDNKKK